MSAKDKGTEQFKLKNYEQAVEFYTQAIAETPDDHSIYGNRSAAYTNMKKFE
jgi:DnaJ family protein C protein 7